MQSFLLCLIQVTLCKPYLTDILHSSSLGIFAMLLIMLSKKQLNVYFFTKKNVYTLKCTDKTLVMWNHCPQEGEKGKSLIQTACFQSRGDLKLQKEGIGLCTRPYWLALLNTWSNTLVSFTKDAKELKFSTEYSLYCGLQVIEASFSFFFQWDYLTDLVSI